MSAIYIPEILVKDEGTNKGFAQTLDFVGTPVDASVSNGDGTINIANIEVDSIVEGEGTIHAGYELNEDGGFALSETGDKVLLEDPQYELNEDGSFALSETGERILLEGSATTTINTVQLLEESTECTHVIVSAKSTNYGPIWIHGISGSYGSGNPAYALGSPIFVPINDVSKVYVSGYVRDGFTFTYGTPTVGSGGGGDTSNDLTFLNDNLSA